MSPIRVHVLYEHGPDLDPHGSAQIRLLRPLWYPALSEHLDVSFGREYASQTVDAVIVDRLWRPDISAHLVQKLVRDVRRGGARLIYALDDNFLDLPPERFPMNPSSQAGSYEEHLWAVWFLLRQADGILVTTDALRQRLFGVNGNIEVIPHALDERLLVGSTIRGRNGPFGPRRVVIGCMGTFTHDDDLLMTLPALQAVWERHPQDVEFQIVGMVGQESTREALRGLPVRMVTPLRGETSYPLFMLWFTGHLRWDIALSPLKDTEFNRCKSDIKFLDYSAMGAAGIYSRVPAYESSVQHLHTGLLVENSVESWSGAIERLVSDDDLRLHLARSAREYLHTRRILAHCSEQWRTAIQNLLEE